MLRLVDEGAQNRAPGFKGGSAQTLAEALPHLRRLMHCEELHPLSRYAAESLVETVERKLLADTPQGIQAGRSRTAKPTSSYGESVPS